MKRWSNCCSQECLTVDVLWLTAVGKQDKEIFTYVYCLEGSPFLPTLTIVIRGRARIPTLPMQMPQSQAAEELGSDHHCRWSGSESQIVACWDSLAIRISTFLTFLRYFISYCSLCEAKSLNTVYFHYDIATMRSKLNFNCFNCFKFFWFITATMSYFWL